MKNENELLTKQLNDEKKQREIDKKNEEEQHQKALEELKEQNKNQIEELKAQIDELLKNNTNDYLDKLKDIEIQGKKEREEYENKIKKEKNEKIKTINADFNKEFEKEINTEIKELLTKFQKEESNFCVEYIQKFDIEKLREMITTLFIKESIGKKIKEKIKIQLSIFLDEPSRKVKHLNILVLGISGVGKSCLISTLLGFENNGSSQTPKEGFYKPQTKGKPKYYNSEIVPFLKLADTQGIEISSDFNENKYGIDKVESDVTQFILENDNSGNPDNYVHCIWYCFQPNSGRFQDDEEKLLKKLSEDYSIDTLPIILVGTQANSKEKIENFRKHLKSSKLNFEFVPIMAKKLDEKEAFGLDVLQKISIEKSMGAIKSKCYQGILQDTKAYYINILEEKTKEIIEIINSFKEKFLNEMSKGVGIKEWRSKIVDIFDIIFKNYNKYLLEDQEKNKNLTNESVKCVIAFISEYFTFCLENLLNCLTEFATKNSQEIAVNIEEFQHNFNSKHENLVYTKTTRQIEKIVKERIIKDFKSQAEIFCNKNALKFLCNLLASNFKEIYIGTFKDILKAKNERSKDIDVLISEKIALQFKEILKQVENYNIQLEKEKKEKEEKEKKEKEKKEKDKNDKLKDNKESKVENGSSSYNFSNLY